MNITLLKALFALIAASLIVFWSIAVFFKRRTAGSVLPPCRTVAAVIRPVADLAPPSGITIVRGR
jgi:hypothetical protein